MRYFACCTVVNARGYSLPWPITATNQQHTSTQYRRYPNDQNGQNDSNRHKEKGRNDTKKSSKMTKMGGNIRRGRAPTLWRVPRIGIIQLRESSTKNNPKRPAQEQNYQNGQNGGKSSRVCAPTRYKLLPSKIDSTKVCNNSFYTAREAEDWPCPSGTPRKLCPPDK